MLRSIWQENLYSVLKQRNMAAMMVACLMITNVLLGIKVFMHAERVIIVPSHFKQSFWAEGEAISKEYLEEMTIFFANLLLNVSPESMRYQGDVALKYVSPEFHNVLFQRLIEEEKKLAKQSLSTTFRVKEVLADQEKNEVIIRGLLTQYVGEKKAGHRTESYKATYSYHSGILLLTGFEAWDDFL
jgi:conjugal transfer pilus assembly protein TraE